MKGSLGLPGAPAAREAARAAVCARLSVLGMCTQAAVRRFVLLYLMASSAAMRTCARLVVASPVQRLMTVGLSPQNLTLQGVSQVLASFAMTSAVSCVARDPACPSEAVLSVTAGRAMLRLAIVFLCPLWLAGPSTIAAIPPYLRLPVV